MNIKSKRYTYVRIQRMLIHILLGIKKEDINLNYEINRILGFNSKGKKYLKDIESDKIAYKNSEQIYLIEQRAAYVYRIITNDESTGLESLNKPIIKED